MVDSRDLYKSSWRHGLHLFFQYPGTPVAGNVLDRIAQSCLLVLQNDLSAKNKSHRAVTKR
jgi:hypothetical protein